MFVVAGLQWANELDEGDWMAPDSEIDWQSDESPGGSSTVLDGGDVVTPGDAILSEHSSQSEQLNHASSWAGSDEFLSVQREPVCRGPDWRYAEGRRDVDYYIDRVQEPIYEGASMTVGQAAFVHAHIKRSHNTKDEAFDKEMYILANFTLPLPNLFPPSLHIVKAIIGVPYIHQFECHVCPNDCYSWGHTPQLLWDSPELLLGNQKCPGCNAARFNRRLLSTGREQLVPAKVSCKSAWVFPRQTLE